MERIRVVLAAFGLCLCAASASAVLISSGDGTGNTSAPPSDPGFAHVGVVNGLSATYLGNGWVLTANHVGIGPLRIGGVTHPVVPSSSVSLRHAPGIPTELRLFRLMTDPGLGTIPIARVPPAVGSSVILVGNGRNRAAPIVWEGASGWLWGPDAAIRWGTNQVTQMGVDIAAGPTRVRSLALRFDKDAGDTPEAIAAVGDSGGAVFAGSQLAGVVYAISTFDGQPAQSALFGNVTLAADLSYYRSAIESVAAGRACGDGLDDDGDGAVDLQDPGCVDAQDGFETDARVACDDGFDSDGDGLVDWPDDPGCADLRGLYENPACDDGLDNDGDGTLDWDGAGVGAADPQCTTGWRCTEAAVGGLGYELVVLAPPFTVLARRRRRRSPRSARPASPRLRTASRLRAPRSRAARSESWRARCRSRSGAAPGLHAGAAPTAGSRRRTRDRRARRGCS